MIFLLLSVCLFSQNNTKPLDYCGSDPGFEAYKLDKFYGNNQNLVNILLKNKVNINENYLDQIKNMETMPIMNPEMFKNPSGKHFIPIKAWVYKNNDGTGNISIGQVYQIVTYLNNTYASNTNISFYLLCDVEQINNTAYNNSGGQYFDTYISENHLQGAINVHFVKNSYSWGGKAKFPWETPNFSCAVETNYNLFGTGLSSTAKILAHEIGHTLGLYHTHHPGRKYPDEQKNEDCGDCYQEAVDRSKRQGVICVSTFNKLKCEVNGDYLCDTQADPALYWPTRNPQLYYDPFNCSYNSNNGKKDNWNDTWTPEVENIMGYATTTCISNFSPLQVAKMYGYISDIGINNPTFNISGTNALCSNQTATYSVNTLPGVTDYFWELPSNMTIVPVIGGSNSNPTGQGTPTIAVKASNQAGGTIKVTPNCGSKPATIDIVDLNNINIEGYDQVCPIYTYTYTAPFISRGDYFWSITNGTILSGQNTRQVQIKMTQNPSNESTLHLQVTNVCSNTINSYKTITHGDPPPPAQQCISYRDTPPEAEPQQKIPFTEFGDMLLLPNPAATEVTIIAPTRGHFILSIFNTMGQSIYGKEPIEIQDKQTIDISAIPDGIYYVKLEGKTGTFNKKLILNK